MSVDNDLYCWPIGWLVNRSVLLSRSVRIPVIMYHNNWNVQYILAVP